ncbi:hypothetical protein HY732_03590 [Candidatus Uhrbacteria bacterium]|nr:hypothetical protein [Candidatus Uhrbacteria bacterium]
MKKSFVASISLVFIMLAISIPVHAAALQEKLSGRILLQVEEKGKAWYIDPATQSRAYLGRPADAFRVMRGLGLGITNSDLDKIAEAGEEQAKNIAFAKKLAGKILLQVQSRGEAWYINPTDFKRYSLGRPADAFSVMRGLGLGVSNKDMGMIPTAEKYADPEQAVVTPRQAAQAEGITPSKTSTPPAKDFSAHAGSYRCWSYNVSGGGGGDCRLFAPIVLNTDGTYSVSSEKGTYSVKDDVVTLSASKLRGPGTLLGGTQIRFEYDYNGWHHTITYLKEGGSASGAQSGAAEVSVQLILEYPAKDSALGGIVTVELVPEGKDVTTADYKPTAIAQYDGNKRIIGSFYKATNMPQTGKKYTVYTNTGFASAAVGTLDLTNTKSETTATITVTGSGMATAEQKTAVTPTGAEIVVEIDLVYPARDSSLGSIQFVVLVPEGQDPAIAVYKPMALAVWDDDKTVVGSFHKATNQVKTKAKYDVYADWGREMIKSGTLDLSTITTGPLKKTFQTTISGSTASSSSGASTQQQTSSSSSTSSSPSQTTYITLNLTLQYGAGDSSLHNVTKILLRSQEKIPLYEGSGALFYEEKEAIAGYGASQQQLVGSWAYIRPGWIYDVFVTSYTIGEKKVGTVDLRGVTSDTTKTISVQ